MSLSRCRWHTVLAFLFFHCDVILKTVPISGHIAEVLPHARFSFHASNVYFSLFPLTLRSRGGAPLTPLFLFCWTHVSSFSTVSSDTAARSPPFCLSYLSCCMNKFSKVLALRFLFHLLSNLIRSTSHAYVYIFYKYIYIHLCLYFYNNCNDCAIINITYKF